jgi:hypothetical protein
MIEGGDASGITLTGTSIGVDITGSSALLNRSRPDYAVYIAGSPDNIVENIAIVGTRDAPMVISGAKRDNVFAGYIRHLRMEGVYIGVQPHGSTLADAPISDFGVYLYECQHVNVSHSADRPMVIGGSSRAGLVIVSDDPKTFHPMHIDGHFGVGADGRANVANSGPSILLEVLWKDTDVEQRGPEEGFVTIGAGAGKTIIGYSEGKQKNWGHLAAVVVAAPFTKIEDVYVGVQADGLSKAGNRGHGIA